MVMKKLCDNQIRLEQAGAAGEEQNGPESDHARNDPENLQVVNLYHDNNQNEYGDINHNNLQDDDDREDSDSGW